MFAVSITCAAFFSASEFAISKSRPIHVNQHAAGKRKIPMPFNVNADGYVFACQIGIALSVLGLSWIAHGTIEKLVQSFVLAMNLSNNTAIPLLFNVSFLSATLAMISVGRLTTKAVAPEPIVLLNEKPLFWAYRFLLAVLQFIKMLANLVFGLFGIRRFVFAIDSYAEEDLKEKLAISSATGNITPFKYAYASKILEFNRLLAKEIMVPRTEMATVEKDMAVKEVFRLAGVNRFTRYPVISGDKDHIIGLVNMKRLLTAYARDTSIGELTAALYSQPIIQVIGSMPIGDLLVKMQREHIHMAILRDEYGGTCGLVTIEDIIEEIVGDIRDEFDTDETPEVQKIGEHHYIFDAKIRIDRVNQLLGIDIREEDIDTIGGWFMSRSFDIIKGQKITDQGYEFLVKESDGHHIRYLEVHKTLNSEHKMT
ncbi:hemolysin family protein [Planomicrobium sp. CPCC 101079]|uniref:hemolysin family protein n=1 Tax=Planomicrobium sp. CPCC 101079 TaxID=2599618 RepID=UPI0021051CD3|nr:hemolysin family protein [Planomicrobium sp. CPCC 101079]